MEANEIMVGDYLRVNRDGICIPKGTIVRVSEIDSENTFREKGLKGSARCEAMDDTWLSGGIWCDYLDPIPLTPKILEKNGFQFYNGIWYVDFDRLDLGVLAIGIDDGCGVGFCIMPDGEVSYFCNSVHQMQHFLRLCLIEKEITL
jgi:hypothetical protein